MLTAKEKSLLAALEPRAASEGVEVVTVEIVGSRKAPHDSRVSRYRKGHFVR